MVYHWWKIIATSRTQYQNEKVRFFDCVIHCLEQPLNFYWSYNDFEYSLVSTKLFLRNHHLVMGQNYKTHLKYIITPWINGLRIVSHMHGLFLPMFWETKAVKTIRNPYRVEITLSLFWKRCMFLTNSAQKCSTEIEDRWTPYVGRGGSIRFFW